MSISRSKKPKKEAASAEQPVSPGQNNATTQQQGPSPAPPAPQAGQQEAKKVSRHELLESIVFGFDKSGTEDQKTTAKGKIKRFLKQTIDNHPVAKRFNVVFLYDETSMVQSDADNIYSAVNTLGETRPILLVLHSSGGSVGPAYLIGKLLHEYSNGNLDIAVPRLAKSAATLLCCAATRIHMGSLSELGPIDPQIEGLPALGLKSSIEHIAKLVADNPKATDLFAQYLSKSVQPIHLGYYERVAESAVQYAERLLRPHENVLCQKPGKIAQDLVYSYKDHGFVIDKQEARTIFGDKVVLHNTDEYKLANDLYQALTLISRYAGIVNHSFYLIGSLASEPGFFERRR